MTLHPASPLLDHCPASLPAADYYDPARHAVEMTAVWAREWVYVGRAADLPPMTLRRVSVAGDNLVLLKDPDGAVAAFHNTCRHRGSELCPEPERRLKSRLITCPYHAWAYALDGRLVRTPFVTETSDFRKDDHGLFRVHVHDWHGFLFACLADEAPDFAGVPDLGPTALDHWPLRELVTGHVLVKEIACNWKVFWENYNECLHCPGIHPELTDMVPVYRRGIMSPSEDPAWTPETPPERALKPGARTWTTSGRPSGPEFPGLTQAERDAGFTFVTCLPSLFIVAHVDYVRAVSLKALGPERTELRAEWLFPAETLAAPGFDLEAVTGFATTVMLQDAAACEMNQRGLRSSRFERGTLMPQEFDIHRFHEWVRRRTAGRPQGATA
jgi:Rieske 2Fe-2S family protein